jgi:predicted RNA-binding Zn ribbon-like protein
MSNYQRFYVGARNLSTQFGGVILNPGMSQREQAPGDLELVRRFVNSIDLEKPDDDALRDGGPAAQWMSEQMSEQWIAPDGGGPEPAPGELQELRTLREGLRAELLSHAGVGPQGTWEHLATLLAGTGFQLGFTSAGGLRLVAQGERPSGARRLRAAIAAAVYDAVRNGTWARLKACRRHSCRFAFYDHSKNASRTWCSMSVCGNRVKAERRRGRERQTNRLG